MEDKIVESVKIVREEIHKELDQELAKLTRDFDGRLQQLKSLYEGGLKSLEALIKNLSTPQVTLTMPPRKTTVTKSIVYGQTGRPDKIVEETEER